MTKICTPHTILLFVHLVPVEMVVGIERDGRTRQERSTLFLRNLPSVNTEKVAVSFLKGCCIRHNARMVSCSLSESDRKACITFDRPETVQAIIRDTQRLKVDFLVDDIDSIDFDT